MIYNVHDIDIEIFKYCQLGMLLMILIAGTLDQLLQKFIVSANVPFKIIENPVLKEIIGRGFPNKIIMSRPTLMKTIENDFQELSLKMKFEMSKCAHIATTADGWLIFKK